MGIWFGFIRRIAVAIGTSSTETGKRKSLLRTAALVLSLVKDHKADSIERLEEAMVQEAEAEAKAAAAAADFKVAEAAEKQAAAAYKRAEAGVKLADVQARLQKAEAERIKAIAVAVDRFASAYSKLKRAGGTVAFVQKELEELVERGKREFPKDQLIETGGVPDLSISDEESSV